MPDPAAAAGLHSGGFADAAPGARASGLGPSGAREPGGSVPGSGASSSTAPGPDPSGSRAPGLSPPGASLSGLLPVAGQDAVVRRTRDGWRVGDDELPDLTCAMVLADLLAAELPTEIQPAVPAAPSAPPYTSQPDTGQPDTSRPDTVAAGGRLAGRPDGRRPAGKRAAGERAGVEEEAHRLRTTVGQLEHALTARIRVEQAIGVLAERHRIHPRQAFEQLRSAARNRGRRVIDIAADVVASASNPLLQLPEELSRQRSAPRHSAKHSRRVLRSE